MAEKIYRCRDDGKIHIGDPTTMMLPQNYVELVRIYHVQKVEESEADYSSQQTNGKTIHYKFTSQSGKDAASKGNIIAVTDPGAITNPDCLKALGHDDMIVELVVEDETDKDEDLRPESV